MQSGGFFVDNTTQQIEISCPIFLRPIMSEILSIGKSIKIIRYLESREKKSEPFTDFKKVYDSLKVKEIKTTKYELNPFLQQCAEKHLNSVVWDTSCKVVNLMESSTHVKNYRDLLAVAPFSWSSLDSNFIAPSGIFQLP